MARRSRAREVVLQILYADDLNPGRDPAATEGFLLRRLGGDESLIAFAKSLLSGVRRNREELDALLVARAENWTLERMATTDRNILRLGAFEILYSDTPPRVSINEAVELAKRFGARQSPQFVNGMLDRFVQERLPDLERAPVEAPVEPALTEQTTEEDAPAVFPRLHVSRPVADMVVRALPEDERLWVPQDDNVWFRPLLLSTAAGEWVNLLRVKKSGVLSRHRHPAPVTGFVIKGSWRYLEHDWIAREGMFIFEPPGEVHTLVVDDESEMITLFHVRGALIYYDEQDHCLGHDDVHTKIELCRRHFEEVGLGADFVQQFVR